VIVDEEQIANAMRLYMDHEDHEIEGAAGVAIAGMIARQKEIAGRNVVAIICGGNISEETLARVRNSADKDQ
jgi:threonine dehydratase